MQSAIRGYFPIRKAGVRRPCVRQTERDSALAAGGLMVLGLFAAAMCQGPAAGLRPWDLIALAAGKPDPMPLEQAAALLGAVRGNAVLWPVLSLVITGGVAGALARYVVPNSRSGGTFGSLMLGVFAAALGMRACQWMGVSLPADVSLLNIGVAFAFAVLTLIVGKLIARY